MGKEQKEENSRVISDIEKDIVGSAARTSEIRKKTYAVLTDDLVNATPTISTDKIDEKPAVATKYFIKDYPDKLMKLAKEKLKANCYYDFLKKNNVKMQFNVVYPAISKSVLAHIIQTSPQLRLNSGLDYILEVSGYAIEAMTDDQIKILFEHEFEHLHCTYKVDKKTDTEIPRLRLKKHDVEEFYSILQKYPKWLENASRVAETMRERMR